MITQELTELADLRDRGLLSDEEFEQAKRLLLQQGEPERLDAPDVHGGGSAGAPEPDPTEVPRAAGSRKKLAASVAVAVAVGLVAIGGQQLWSERAADRAAEAERVALEEFNWKPTGPLAGTKPPDDPMTEALFLAAMASRSQAERDLLCSGYDANSDQAWTAFNTSGNTVSRVDFEYLMKQACLTQVTTVEDEAPSEDGRRVDEDGDVWWDLSDAELANDVSIARPETDRLGITTVDVSVTNSADRSSSYVVHVGVLDADGDLIEESHALPQSVPPGETTSYELIFFKDLPKDISLEVLGGSRVED